jgi:hypothetical protein
MKRGYSRNFPKRSVRRVALTVGDMPPTLLKDFKARAAREGESMRNIVLCLIEAWTLRESGALKKADLEHLLVARVADIHRLEEQLQALQQEPAR